MRARDGRRFARPGRGPENFSVSQPGNYLAALIASADRDSASAESYYREALRIDPRNPDLLERTFGAALSNGDEQAADSLGERLLDPGPDQQSRAVSRSLFTPSGRDNMRSRAPTWRRRRSSIEGRDGGPSDGLDLRRSK